MDVTSFIESDSELEDYEDLLFPYKILVGLIIKCRELPKSKAMSSTRRLVAIGALKRP